VLSAEPAPVAVEASTGEASGREFVALVTFLMAMTAVGIDVMLPAFPEIRQEFGMAADSTAVTWLLTAYFLGMAVGPWVFGPASDRYGRRPLLVVRLGAYAAAAAAAAFAPTWGLVVASRFVWGLAAGGPRTLAVAMVRDRYEGDAMARLMSMIMAIFLLVPIVAPGVGAGLIAVLPWRSVFVAPAVVAIGLIVWSRRLPETLPVERRRPFTWGSVGRAGREVVTHRTTMAMTLAMTFLFALMTTYLSASEIILEDVYGYGAWFPLFFGVVAGFLAISSLNNARLVQRLGVVTLVRRLSLIGMVAAGVLVVIALATGGRPNFWLFAVVIAVMLPMAQGLSPNANTIAMSPLPHVAGTASAVIATVTIAGGALFGSLANDAFDGTVRPYATFTFAYLTIATALVWWGTRERPAVTAAA
jgi:DHA1 family bicyclomycin/chloramphenicol resistance-like MFS transporter